MSKIRKTLLEYDGEGGSIGIFQSGEGPEATYLIISSEFDLDDNFYRKETVFQSFEDAYRFLAKRYKLQYLHCSIMLPELEQTIHDINTQIAELRSASPF